MGAHDWWKPAEPLQSKLPGPGPFLPPPEENVCRVGDDPFAQQMTGPGLDPGSVLDAFGYLFDQPTAKPAARTEPFPVGHHADDTALKPIRSGLNDKGLSHEDRAQRMLGYRNKQIPMLEFGAIERMQSNDAGMPVYLSGANKGMQVPLYEKLGSDPKMQEMMAGVATRISSVDPDKLDMAQIWTDAQEDARKLSTADPWDPVVSNTAETNMMALQAMATLFNAQKFGKSGPPKKIADKLPPELWTKIDAASKAMEKSKSPNAAVMSQGVAAAPTQGAPDKPFSLDNNFHFFSHAYLAASLQQQHGAPSHRAQATSGFIGAQYELQPGSVAEHSGNSGLKDIIMNAEGADFGTSLLNTPETLLPNKFSGPPTEDRSIPNADRKKLPSGVQDVVDRAADTSMSAKILSALGGGLTRKIDMDIQIQEDTGIPMTGSPHH